MARIPGFHPGGPGSIPGVGEYFLEFCFSRLQIGWRRAAPGALLLLFTILVNEKTTGFFYRDKKQFIL